MAVSWTDVVAIAPELSTVPTASQTKFLDIATRQVDTDAWGDFADDGITYLAAHLASIRSNSGLVTSETLGPMSRGYANPPGIMGSLALSTYGAEYVRLLRLAVGPAAFVP